MNGQPGEARGTVLSASLSAFPVLLDYSASLECFSSRTNAPAARRNTPEDAKNELPRPKESPKAPPMTGPVTEPSGSTAFSTPKALLLKSRDTDCAVRIFPFTVTIPLKNPNTILNKDRAAMFNHAP